MVVDWIIVHWQILVVASLLVATLVLFLTERLPFEITALFVLVVLAGTGILTLGEAFSGFSNSAMLTVLMMFVLSEAVVQVGIVDWLGDRIAPRFGTHPVRQTLVIVLLVAPVSAFINNAAAVAVLIPLVMRLCATHGQSPSKLLIPLSYASMLGGVVTVIGTSTNLLASDLAEREGLGSLGMFSFAKVGLIVLLVGAAYLVLIGHRLVPARVKPQGIDERFHLREFIFEATVPATSSLVGKPIEDGALPGPAGVEVLHVVRGAHRFEPQTSVPLEADDQLLVKAPRAVFQSLLDSHAVELLPVKGTATPASETHAFAELMVGYNSSARGKRLGQMDLQARFGVQAVALLAQNRPETLRLYARRLDAGDVILVHGRNQGLEALTGGDEFVVLGGPAVQVRRRDKMGFVLTVLVAVVGLAALGLAPILLTATGGVVALVVGNALRMQDLYRAIHWEVILLLAGIIPLGIALEKTGAASGIAELIAAAAPYVPPVALLALVYVIAMGLTELVSNNAAILLVGPIAIELARQLGHNPLTFLLAAMFAASTPFLTPIGYKTNLLVFAPGGYRFSDYARVGAPLNLLLAILTPLLLAYFFPL